MGAVVCRYFDLRKVEALSKHSNNNQSLDVAGLKGCDSISRARQTHLACDVGGVNPLAAVSLCKCLCR